MTNDIKDQILSQTSTTPDGQLFESKEIHKSSSFLKINSAAAILREALSEAGLTAKDGRIVLSDEAFTTIFDDRTKDRHRPEWRSSGIAIEPTNKVVK